MNHLISSVCVSHHNSFFAKKKLLYTMTLYDIVGIEYYIRSQAHKAHIHHIHTLPVLHISLMIQRVNNEALRNCIYISCLMCHIVLASIPVFNCLPHTYQPPNVRNPNNTFALAERDQNAQNPRNTYLAR